MKKKEKKAPTMRRKMTRIKNVYGNWRAVHLIRHTFNRRYHMRSYLMALLVSALNFSRAEATPASHRDTLIQPCLQKAEQLLNEALSFMEKNYYHRSVVNWNDLAAQAHRQLINADNCDDAY